ncbi:hypothetical protein D3C78_1137260 [compost metagenome]
MQGKQRLEHLVAGLFIVADQGAEHRRILVWVLFNQLGLVLGQAVIDHEQLDPSAARQADDLRRHVLLVDEHQVVGPLRALQHLSRLGQGQFRAPLAVFDTQVHPQVLGSGLHEL